jgi:predicted nucleic acid-binding protein
MSGKVFLDSNIWVYAATGREEFPSKFRRAREIVEEAEIGVSTQVVGEFVNAGQRPRRMRRALTPDETAKWVEQMFFFPLVEVDRQIVESAVFIQRRYRLGYWDSQIIASAERFGADVLLSEDLSHMQRYGSLRCNNPFAEH